MEKASREGMYDLLPESLEIHKSPFRLEMHGARWDDYEKCPWTKSDPPTPYRPLRLLHSDEKSVSTGTWIHVTAEPQMAAKNQRHPSCQSPTNHPWQ